MKKFYIVAAAILMSGNVAAQKKFTHQALKNMVKAEPAKKETVVKAPAKVRKAQSALYLPQHEDVFFYDDGEWLEDGSADLTYDSRGNVLTHDYTMGEGERTLTKYTYNENNLWETMTESSFFEDNLEGVLFRTRKFDTIVKNFDVENFYYDVDGDSKKMSSRSFMRDVTRDDKDNITGITHKDYFDGKFDETRKTALTYNSDGKADTWNYKQLEYDYDSGEYYWEDYYTLTDMEWYKTDGQITTYDYEDMFQGDNLLASAYITEPDYGVTGKMEGIYEDNGNYSIIYTYLEDEVAVERDKRIITYTDEYGSFEIELIYYQDINGDGVFTEDEIVDSGKEIVKYDANGEIVEEKYYMGEELLGNTKYDIDYGEYSYPVEWIMSEYDFDMEAFVPSTKIVRSDFVDVANLINGVTASDANGVQEVYNAQGMKLGSQISNLPAGLYVVKQNGKTQKVLKK